MLRVNGLLIIRRRALEKKTKCKYSLTTPISETYLIQFYLLLHFFPILDFEKNCVKLSNRRDQICTFFQFFIVKKNQLINQLIIFFWFQKGEKTAKILVDSFFIRYYEKYYVLCIMKKIILYNYYICFRLAY